MVGGVQMVGVRGFRWYLRETSAFLLQEVVLLELVVAVELMPRLQELKPTGEDTRRG